MKDADYDWPKTVPVAGETFNEGHMRRWWYGQVMRLCAKVRGREGSIAHKRELTYELLLMSSPCWGNRMNRLSTTYGTFG